MKIKVLLSVIAVLFVAVLYLLYLNLQKPAVLVDRQLPPISPTVTVTSDPTKGWEVYEDKIYGYSFKYPTSLPYNTIDILDYKKSLTFENWVRNMETEEICNELECPGKFKYTLKKTVSIHDKDAVYYEDIGMAGPRQLLFINLGNYKIAYITFIPKQIVDTSSVSDINKQLFTQILSTFKFTDVLPTSSTTPSLKLYSSTKYGLSFKYPSNTKVFGDMSNSVFTLTNNNQTVSVSMFKLTDGLSLDDAFLLLIDPRDPQSVAPHITFSDKAYNGYNFRQAIQDVNFFNQQPGGFNNMLVKTTSQYMVQFQFPDNSKQFASQIFSSLKLIN